MKRWEGYLYVGPFLFFYFAILVWPLLSGIWLSLHRADPFGARLWVGAGNYARLFADPVFGRALLNTFLYALLIVPTLTLVTLGLALALNRATRSAAFLRGAFFSSSVLSVTIVTLIWRFILTPDAGLAAVVLQALGREPVPFLSDPRLTLPAVAITTVWWSLGLPMMLFLAGLQQIPRELYEAAALDRANRWRTLTRVTLPQLSRTLALVAMLQTAAQLQLFGQAQLLTGGGPGGSSRPVVLFIFESAFARWELGYAMAAAELLFLLVLAVTLVQYLTVQREGAR